MPAGNVLIVEDKQELADLYGGWLEGSFGVTVVYNGRQALDVLDKRGDDVDVVLVDRRMPGLSGDELIEIIRDRESEYSVAVVSAVTPDIDIAQLGFNEYLTKPVDREELETVVHRLVNQASYDKQVRDHLALISKKQVLEEEKRREELVESEEYRRLEEKITASREGLDTALSGDVFVELLLNETGDRLYAVLQYDAESWEYRYVGADIEELIATMRPDIDAVLEQFRREGQQNAELCSTFELDRYNCSLHHFEGLVLIHFYQSDGQGIVCAFDTDAATHLTEFVGLVRPYLDQAEFDNIGDPVQR
jgi:DNA-binding response OmpR family regulator